MKYKVNLTYAGLTLATTNIETVGNVVHANLKCLCSKIDNLHYHLTLTYSGLILAQTDVESEGTLITDNIQPRLYEVK